MPLFRQVCFYNSSEIVNLTGIFFDQKMAETRPAMTIILVKASPVKLTIDKLTKHSYNQYFDKFSKTWLVCKFWNRDNPHFLSL